MNSHIRGPVQNGQGAIVGQRGLAILFSAVAATTTLLKVETRSSTTPVRVDLDFVVEDAFNGTGAACTVTRTKASDGTTSTVLTGTFAAGDNVRKSVLCYGNDTFNVVFAPGTSATTGRGAVFARAAGIGQLVG